MDGIVGVEREDDAQDVVHQIDSLVQRQCRPWAMHIVEVVGVLRVRQPARLIIRPEVLRIGPS